MDEVEDTEQLYKKNRNYSNNNSVFESPVVEEKGGKNDVMGKVVDGKLVFEMKNFAAGSQASVGSEGRRLESEEFENISISAVENIPVSAMQKNLKDAAEKQNNGNTDDCGIESEKRDKGLKIAKDLHKKRGNSFDSPKFESACEVIAEEDVVDGVNGECVVTENGYVADKVDETFESDYKEAEDKEDICFNETIENKSSGSENDIWKRDFKELKKNKSLEETSTSQGRGVNIEEGFKYSGRVVSIKEHYGHMMEMRRRSEGNPFDKPPENYRRSQANALALTRNLEKLQVTEAQRSIDDGTQLGDASFKRSVETNRCDGIRKSFESRGISEELADFILSSWTEGTKQQYQHAWTKWSIWNSIRFTSSFYTSEAVVLKYLYYLFLSGKSYSVINTHKAMLLQTLPFYGNRWCKSCELIPRFMKSVFLHKPARPRYLVMWDVSIVLNFLKGLKPLSDLSLKQLTLKTVALIALATAPRAQTLVSMSLDNMIIEQQAVVFLFPNILKTSRVGHSYSLKIEHFHDESLCAMHCLLAYLKATVSKRTSRSLFISYVTFDKVTSSTIARWLKTVLELSGIDSKVFKAHSFRGAASSKAYNSGCSIKSILETADWKSDSNFKKFYYRSYTTKSLPSFTKAVFSDQ